MKLQPFTPAEWLTIVNLARAARDARVKARILKRAGLKASAKQRAEVARELEQRIINEAKYDARGQSQEAFEGAH